MLGRNQSVQSLGSLTCHADVKSVLSYRSRQKREQAVVADL